MPHSLCDIEFLTSLLATWSCQDLGNVSTDAKYGRRTEILAQVVHLMDELELRTIKIFTRIWTVIISDRCTTKGMDENSPWRPGFDIIRVSFRYLNSGPCVPSPKIKMCAYLGMRFDIWSQISKKFCVNGPRDNAYAKLVPWGIAVFSTFWSNFNFSILFSVSF